jgi:ribosomal protein S18 acetylase RimI-like enzyme
MHERADVVIRPARADEIDTVLALWTVADAVPSITDDAGSLERLLARDPDALLLACAREYVVGSIIAAWDGWRGNLYRLAVHPDHRRRGIGRTLVAAGETRLRVQGARRVTALVVREHDQAVGTWRAVGYEHDARIDRYVTTLDPDCA